MLGSGLVTKQDSHISRLTRSMHVKREKLLKANQLDL